MGGGCKLEDEKTSDILGYLNNDFDCGLGSAP